MSKPVSAEPVAWLPSDELLNAIDDDNFTGKRPCPLSATIKQVRELKALLSTHPPVQPVPVTQSVSAGPFIDLANMVAAMLARPPAQPVSAEPLAMAIRFHETYERLAPQFGYATRPDTKAFDPDSANGRLMIAVCSEVFAHPPVQPVSADVERLDQLEAMPANYDITMCQPGNHGGEAGMWLVQIEPERGPNFEGYGITLRAAIDAAIRGLKR